MDNVLAQHQARQAARPIYSFDLPDELVALGDPYIKKSIGMVKLTMDEERECYAASAGVSSTAAFLLAQKALVEVDDKPLNKGEAEEFTVLNNTDPVIRDLITDAYVALSSTTKANKEAFIKSRRVKVG